VATLAATVCATAGGGAGESAEARRAPPPVSLVSSLREADVVVVARAAAARSTGYVELEVIESCKGSPGPARIAVACPAAGGVEPRQPEGCPEDGALVLAFLATQAAEPSLLPLPHLGLVSLDPTEPGEACAVTAQVDRASGDPQSLAVALRRGSGLRSGGLRRAALSDLAPLVGPADLPWLRRTIGDRAALEELRLWAVVRTASLELPELPVEVAELLEPGDGVRLRQAALRAHGARGDHADLDILRRGLADPDPAVRLAAVDAFDAPAAVALLARQLAVEGSSEVQVAIVGRLGASGTPEAMDALRALRARAPEPALLELIEVALRAAESRAPSADPPSPRSPVPPP
jgi:hypothetical protein